MNKLTLLTLIFSATLIISLIVKNVSSGNYEMSTEKITAEVANDSLNTIIVKLSDMDDILKKNEKYQFVDLRNKDNFSKGHLKNAINLPVDEIVKQKSFSDFNNGKQNVLYSGDYAIASNIAFYLKQIGFENVKYLQANFADAQNYINNPKTPISSNQETAKYDYNKYFNQPVKETKPKLTVPEVKKVKRASGGC